MSFFNEVTLSELRGGDFKSGLIGGFVGHWAGGHALTQFPDQMLPQMMVVGLAGGLSARASGGSFEDGALAAAFSHLFNNMTQKAVQKKPKVIDSTSKALSHYLTGDGEAVDLGPNTRKALKKHPLVKRQSKALRAGTANHLNDNLSVELKGDIFHVGKTRVNFSTTCQSGSCTTTYVGFANDGFWDPIAPPGFGDGIGGNWEIPGGTGYHYNSYEWTETYMDNF